MDDKEDEYKYWGTIVNMFKQEYWKYANRTKTLKDADDIAANKAIIELIKGKLTAVQDR